MKHRSNSWLRKCFRAVIGAVVMAACLPGGAWAAANQNSAEQIKTRSPIKHLIVIVGENRTFDNVFGAYQPRGGQKIMNLLSQGIIKSDGSPGPNFSHAAQNRAKTSGSYSIDPVRVGPYRHLPRPHTSGALGQPEGKDDVRFPARLVNGPFQLTRFVPYPASFTGDPVHRFFQMWQQVGKGKSDLFVWVANTASWGGQSDPKGRISPTHPYQGAVAMGYYNMSAGDAPLLKLMADNYAIGDNFHQGIMGGTGANFIFLGTGDVAYFSDGKGAPRKPFKRQIEDPNPRKGTQNFYRRDGYLGGSYVNCSDPGQPGVSPILNYLKSLGRETNCASNTYYLVNNYKPGFNPDGSERPLGPKRFVVPPQTLPTIADSLSAAGVSWKYYIGGWNHGKPDSSWCPICNPFQFVRSVMTNPKMRANIKGIRDFYDDLAARRLPAVAFVRPPESYDGHPAYSSLSLFEDFVTEVTNAVIHDHRTFSRTAIVITMDEGGGYYDSGHVEALDFFGDGTRIPVVVISRYAKKGFVDHTYYDHASILKFIERNWKLKPLSDRSRDRLPNPKAWVQNPYVPTNGPAIGDLWNMFDFRRRRPLRDTPLIIRGAG